MLDVSLGFFFQETDLNQQPENMEVKRLKVQSSPALQRTPA